MYCFVVADAVYSCDVELNRVEDNTYCNLEVDRDRPYGWQRNKGSTPTDGTGPTVDHTNATPQGSVWHSSV